MRRFCLVIALLQPLVIAGCRIEQTPQRFIDHQQTPAEEIAASEGELRSRLLAMASALQRRSAAEVTLALQPHPNVQVIGPAEGVILSSAEQITAALSDLAGPGPGTAEHLSVTVGPRNNVAWFLTEYAGGSAPAGPDSFRFSGVFLRHDGEWRLINGHLSRPIVAGATVAADTAASP